MKTTAKREERRPGKSFTGPASVRRRFNCSLCCCGASSTHSASLSTRAMTCDSCKFDAIFVHKIAFVCVCLCLVVFPFVWLVVLFIGI